MTNDRPLLGIAFMLGFCILAPLGDGFAKLLSHLPLIQVVAVRFGIQALVLLPIVWVTKRKLSMSWGFFGLMALRTFLHFLGIALMFLSLRYLPLADAVAIAFVMPFILMLLGWKFLGEHVGPRRMIACAVGFAGTMLVVQPSFAEVGVYAFLPVAVAVVFALFILSTRVVAQRFDAISLQAVSGVVASAFLIPAVLLADGSGLAALDPVLPQGRDVIFLLSLGLLGTLSHLLMTWSLRFAPSATLAPMQYLEIPFATIFGWLIFKDFPNGLALVGILILLGSGLYIVWREQVTAKAARSTQPLAPPAA